MSRHVKECSPSWSHVVCSVASAHRVVTKLSMFEHHRAWHLRKFQRVLMIVKATGIWSEEARPSFNMTLYDGV